MSNPDPSWWDFPCSSVWRRHYNRLCDPYDLIDFPVSEAWARFYVSQGIMRPESLPDLVVGREQREPPMSQPTGPGKKRPSERDWLRIGMALAKAQPQKPKAPEVKDHKLRGVLR